MRACKGTVKARIVQTRFAISGKIASVQKHTGDNVKKGEIIASLDRKILQTGLDKELADYEKIRADFEIFAQKYPDPTEAIDKYLKTEKQASLNASVKNVELAKAVLDQTTLFSPVEGIIIDDNNLVAGLYITPAGSEIKIIDMSSYYFEIEISENEIPYFTEKRKCKIGITSTNKTFETESKSVISDGNKFLVQIPIEKNEGIFLGLNGKANF